MTRRSPLTRRLTPAQRAEFHRRLQLRLGHWLPTGAKPRPASSYRGYRRNVKFDRRAFEKILSGVKDALEIARAA